MPWSGWCVSAIAGCKLRSSGALRTRYTLLSPLESREEPLRSRRSRRGAERSLSGRCVHRAAALGEGKGGGGPDRKFRFEKYFTEFSSGPIVVSTLLRHAQTRFYDDTRGSY